MVEIATAIVEGCEPPPYQPAGVHCRWLMTRTCAGSCSAALYALQIITESPREDDEHGLGVQLGSQPHGADLDVAP